MLQLPRSQCFLPGTETPIGKIRRRWWNLEKNRGGFTQLQGGAPIRERVQVVYKYYFTRVREWGLYRTSYWDYKPTFTSLGGHHLVTFFSFRLVLCFFPRPWANFYRGLAMASPRKTLPAETNRVNGHPKASWNKSPSSWYLQISLQLLHLVRLFLLDFNRLTVPPAFLHIEPSSCSMCSNGTSRSEMNMSLVRSYLASQMNQGGEEAAVGSFFESIELW